MIVRYHLTTGKYLDEEVPFGTTVDELTAALVGTLLTPTKAGGLDQTHILIVNLSEPGQTTVRKNLLRTDHIVRMEILLSEMEERREASSRGVN